MKFLNHQSLAVAAILSAGAFAHAAPLVSIGDSIDVFFNGSTNVQWRSNLFYTDGIEGTSLSGQTIFRPKVDAWVFYVSPGVEINIGRNSNANISIYFREDFLFYSKYSDSLNTALANLYVDGVYDWGNLQTSAGFSFVQTQQNTPSSNGFNFVANLVKTDNYKAYLDADYDISPKAWVSTRFDWNYVDYTNNDEFYNRYSNRSVYSVPVSFFWRLTPKLSIGPSFRFRYTDPDSSGGYFNGIVGPTNVVENPDYFDYFLNFAVRGEVLPKLELGLNVGYQIRQTGRDRVVTSLTAPLVPGLNPNYTNDGSRGQFSFLMDATYEVTPKLLLTTDFYHDSQTAAQGQTVVNLGGDIGAIYQINEYISANTEFGMESSDYQNSNGRSDLTTTASVSVNYRPDIYWTISLGYFYMNNHSNSNQTATNLAGNSGASFMAHTVNLQATLRY